MVLRSTVIILLLVQGVYDLTLGGWMAILQWQLLEKTTADTQARLHSIYCHCKHCPDINNCCCIPDNQLSGGERISQCEPAREAKLLSTWSSRVASSSEVVLFVPQSRIEVGYSPLHPSLCAYRFEHPPRA